MAIAFKTISKVYDVVINKCVSLSNIIKISNLIVKLRNVFPFSIAYLYDLHSTCCSLVICLIDSNS